MKRRSLTSNCVLCELPMDLMQVLGEETRLELYAAMVSYAFQEYLHGECSEVLNRMLMNQFVIIKIFVYIQSVLLSNQILQSKNVIHKTWKKIRLNTVNKK